MYELLHYLVAFFMKRLLDIFYPEAPALQVHPRCAMHKIVCTDFKKVMKVRCVHDETLKFVEV